MTTVRLEVGVASTNSADEVFAAMVDLRSQERWILATKLFALDGPTPVPDVGSKIAAFTSVFGFGFLDLMTVTEYQPGRLWRTRHTGAVVRGEGIFAVQPAGSGCRAVWIEDVDVPFGVIGRAGFALVKPVVAAALRASLRRLVSGVRAGRLPVHAVRAM